MILGFFNGIYCHKQGRTQGGLLCERLPLRNNCGTWLSAAMIATETWIWWNFALWAVDLQEKMVIHLYFGKVWHPFSKTLEINVVSLHTILGTAFIVRRSPQINVSRPRQRNFCVRPWCYISILRSRESLYGLCLEYLAFRPASELAVPLTFPSQVCNQAGEIAAKCLSQGQNNLAIVRFKLTITFDRNGALPHSASLSKIHLYKWRKKV